ncbi:MAG TPA: hypothetical protein VEG67_00870, partial [Myxococcota bacterium]|nr:hypothetical protein [Myxococcota bacterium]
MSLSTLLRDGRPRALVAFAQEARFPFEQFEAQVRALAAALGSPSRESPSAERAVGERWLLQVSDSYAFAVGLFALWHRGSVAVLPPNAAPGTLARLAAQVAGAISDRPELLPDGRVLNPLQPSGDSPRPPPLSL